MTLPTADAAGLLARLRAEHEALLALEPIYQAEKSALANLRLDELPRLIQAQENGLAQLRDAVTQRQAAFAHAGIGNKSGEIEAFIEELRDEPARRLWQSLRATKQGLSLLHRVVAHLLAQRQAAAERALSVLTATHRGQGLYDSHGAPRGLALTRSGVAV
jgi:flagellar biosynthesis/type III secretory pathway chaperone